MSSKSTHPTGHHVHQCKACDAFALRYDGGPIDPVQGTSSLPFRYCDCDDPEADRPCRDRIPGERNMSCPTLKDHGAENLTQRMRAEYGYPTPATNQSRGIADSPVSQPASPDANANGVTE
jgi:hypothetical protein